MILGSNLFPVLFWALFELAESAIFNTAEITKFNEPSYCAVDEYFNVNQLKCITCDSDKNLIPSLDGFSCVCNERSKIKKWNFGSFPICELCKENEVPTKDQLDCILCPSRQEDNTTSCEDFQCPSNSVIDVNTPSTLLSKVDIISILYLENNNHSSPSKCDTNRLPLKNLARTPNGSLHNELLCLECEPGMEPSYSKKSCSPCKQAFVSDEIRECICREGETRIDGLCFKDVSKNWSDQKVPFTVQYENKKQVDSQFLRDNLLKSIMFCKMGNHTACQALANMCAMLMYSDFGATSPCSVFRDRKRIPATFTDSVPWLFYGESDAPTVLSRKRIPTQFNIDLNSHLNILNLTAIVYSPEGNFKKITNVGGHYLQLCPASWKALNESFRFASNYFYSCHIPAKQMLHMRDTEFIELFLRYKEDNRDLLYAIPVLILNIANEGQYKNKENDQMQWQLVRRMFLVDKLSGLSFEENQIWRKNEIPEVVRYAKSVSLNVKLQGRENPGKIFVPYLTVEYDEITKEEVERDGLIYLSFKVDFQMENNLSHALEVCIGVFSGLAVVWSGIQTWGHSKRSGRLAIDLTSIVTLMLFTCGNLANVFFFVVFCASLYFLIFFKGQSAIHVLLPTESQEEVIKLYLCFTFFLKMIEIVQLIYNQITIDIFFIDWERPKARSLVTRKLGPGHKNLENDAEEPVSIWRTYFVANEWNEIQTKRKINVNIHLLLTVFILKVLGLEFWAISDPELYNTLPTYRVGKEFSLTCRFTVGASVYILIYIIQRLVVALIYERFIKNGIQEFVDMCSMANISVFILAYENYGYYIHGRSAHGFADTDMQNIINQFQREEEDLVGHRGLLPGTDQQTFEIAVPTQLRAYYKRVMAPLRNRMSQAVKRITISTMSGRSKTGSANLDKSVQAYHSMNRFLAAFLEHALKDLDYEVRNKLFAEILLEMEFSDPSEKGIFYSDSGHSFDNVLFYGNELSLFSLDIMLFSFVVVLSEDYLVAGMVTAALSYILTIIKDVGSRKNLAKKTLIDERFLI